jgi:uncharacterized protein YciI
MKLLVCLFAIACAISHANAHEPSRLYIVHFKMGPAWIADKPFEEQAHAREHSQNLARLRREGTLLLGARYAEKGMIVLRATSAAAAQAQIEKDAAVQARVFVYEISELQPFYEGCVTVSPDKDKCKN